jgi:site-specific recombinase XerD
VFDPAIVVIRIFLLNSVVPCFFRDSRSPARGGERFRSRQVARVTGEDADIFGIRTEHVAAYREWLIRAPAPPKGKNGFKVEKVRSVPTAKLKLSAIRSMFRYLKEGGILAEDPAASVRAPKFSRSIGKTAVLEGREAARILDRLTEQIEEDADDLIALRDRALIGVMTFTFARVLAAVGLTPAEVFLQNNRRHVQLHEKGGKQHVMPCHHELDGYLMAYIEMAGLRGQSASPLFRAVDNKTRRLGKEPLSRTKAWGMVQRRARAAGVSTAACNHTFSRDGHHSVPGEWRGDRKGPGHRFALVDPHHAAL